VAPPPELLLELDPLLMVPIEPLELEELLLIMELLLLLVG
jgi:hypothetical protein